MKIFTLDTKIGSFCFKVNGPNKTIYLQNGPFEYKAVRPPIIIRGVNHSSVSIHFGINPKTNLFDGVTYKYDGNTQTFVSDENSEGFKARAVYASKGMLCEATSAAKIKIYETVIESLNNFYLQNKSEIDEEFLIAKKQDIQSKKEGLEEKIKENSKELENLQNELKKLAGIVI